MQQRGSSRLPLVLFQQPLDVALECVRVVEDIGQAAPHEMPAAPANTGRGFAGYLFVVMIWPFHPS